jgi:glycosyltransferase involved in cell wall biosynthesis
MTPLIKDNPLVSVTIPTYRRPDTLRKALSSVMAQTYKKLEIIISNNDIDDAATNDLCRECAARDPRIKYFAQPTNLGICGNVNFLADRAGGAFCLAICDDDWVSDNFIELAIPIMRKDKSCSVVYGRLILYDAERRIYESVIPEAAADEDYAERIISLFRFLPSGGFFRTADLKECLYQDRYGEDRIFFVKILFLGKLLITPEITYHKLYDVKKRTVAHYAKLFAAQGIDETNDRERTCSLIVDAILHDSFFTSRLERMERVELAVKVARAHPRNGYETVAKKKLLRYLYRHPLALIKNNFEVIFERKKLRARVSHETNAADGGRYLI